MTDCHNLLDYLPCNRSLESKYIWPHHLITRAGHESIPMNSNPHETRLFKRQRILPDGFAVTPAPKTVYKPVVPQFSSAFSKGCTSEPASNPRSSSSTKKSTDCLKERKHVLSDFSTTESADELKERRYVLHALVPPRPIQPDARPYTAKDKSSTFLPALHESLISGQLKTDAPILQLRPPPKPPIIIPSYHIPATTNALLKPPIPPPPLLANKHSSKDLKSLQPPPLPPPPNPAIDGKNLRTISKTRVALATDLSTDNGVAELASIFLHDQRPDITLLNSHPDNHDGRGLELSPEKKGKGKFSKFVR